MSKILVTGVNGFVGRHLARELHSRGDEVIGLGREDTPNMEISGLLKGYAICDLLNPTDVAALSLDGFDSIINLAGLAQVGDSFKNPEAYKKINVDVLAVLGQRIVSENIAPRVIAISTGAIYDNAQPLPLSEDSGLAQNGSPYAQSKIMMEAKASELRSQGLDCIVVRPFNHIGPGQENGFLVPDLYRKITNSLANREPLLVGNLKTRRDYTDVRDVVRAYADLAETKSLSHDLYNVCSGRSIEGEQILNLLLEALGTKDKIEVKVDQTLIRPDDPADLYGSNDRLRTDTGWQPKIKIEQTIKDFVVSKN